VLDELAARAAGFDAVVRDDRDAYALIAVQARGHRDPGPADRGRPAGLKYYTCLHATVAGRPALLARTGYTGEDGFELFVAPGDAEHLWTALSEAGSAPG